MSFYGKVTYYLSDAFKQQIYDNEGIDTVDSAKGSGAINSIITLNPKGKDDACTIKSGNTWLRFAADPIQDTSVYLYHKLAGNDEGITMDNTNLNVAKSNSENADISLGFGEIVTIPQIVYDAAGHIQPTSRTISVKMPQATQELDLNDLKLRIANLEEAISGQHGDSGGGSSGGENPDPENPGGGDDQQEDPVTPVQNPMENRLSYLERHIQEWIMQGDSAGEGINNNWLESKGIGSTLHDLLVFLGLEQEQTDALTNRKFYQDIAKGTAFPIYSSHGINQVLPAVSSAYTQADTAALAASQLKTCIRQLLELLRDKTIADTAILNTDQFNALYAFVAN